jgi:hypothetical protein
LDQSLVVGNIAVTKAMFVHAWVWIRSHSFRAAINRTLILSKFLCDIWLLKHLLESCVG